MTKYLHMIGDLERISDHAVNIVESAREIHEKEITFSTSATEEIRTIVAAVREILDMSKDTIRFYEKNGMLTYEVNQENGYHEYSIWDVFNLLDCLSCRKLGISVRQSLKLKRDGSIDESIAEYET